MRVFDWKSLAIGIAAAGVGYWVIQPGTAATSGTIEDKVAQIAARMHGVTPQPMADGSTLRSVDARGRTITLGIDGQADWTSTTTDSEVTDARAAELCAQSDLRALIAGGAQVVIEGRTSAGERLPTLVVDHCDTA